MKRAIYLTCLSAAAMMTLAGCGRTVVRETVVERPAPVVKETVVEKRVPVPVQREVIVAGPASCSVGGTAYSQGSLSCQGGEEYRCNAGAWEQTRRYC
jgi:hypothetical protein